MVIAPSGACMKPGAGGGSGPPVGFAGGGGGQGGGGGTAGAGGGGQGGIDPILDWSTLEIWFDVLERSDSEN